MGGVIGFDLPAVLACGDAFGVPRAVMAILASRAEGPMVAGLNNETTAEPPQEDEEEGDG
jgi:hypothetical protein